MATNTLEQTIYDKYGGFSAIRKVIFSFYEAALDSDIIGDFFEKVDMNRIVDHQTKFVSYLLGSPVDYSDQRLSQVHAHLGIRDFHFDEMKEILADTLDNHGFAAGDTEIVLDAIEARRRAIVS
jgi:hemoglobin